MCRFSISLGRGPASGEESVLPARLRRRLRSPTRTAEMLPILPFGGGRALAECFGKRRLMAAIISAAVALGAASLSLTLFHSAGAHP